MTSHSTVSKPGTSRGRSAQRHRERLLLVEAGDLDDQLHVDGERRYRARQTVSTRMEGSTLTRPRAGHRLRARRSRAPGARRPRSPRSPSRCSAWASRSASSSSRPTRSTTPTTRCCGAATCCTGTRWSSTASATRPSTRWRSPRARPAALRHVGGPPVGGADPRPRSWCWWPASTGSGGSPRRRWSARSRPALLLTRFDYPFLAARGYIDIPYMALVVWAATLEATRPRRGMPVLMLLALRRACCAPRRGSWPRCTGVWVAWKATWRERFLFAALAAHRPAGLGRRSTSLVTGDPLFSQHYTGGLGRGPRPPAPAVGAAGGDPGVLREPRQAAGVRRRGRRARCSGS